MYKIRKATIDDFEQILSLNSKLFLEEKECYDKTLNEEWPESQSAADYYQAVIDEHYSCCFVAEANSKVVAHATALIRDSYNCRIPDKHLLINFVYVVPEFRKQGIATSILEAMVEWAKCNDLEIIKINTYSKNEKAQRLYKKLGFDDYHVSLEKRI